MFESLCDDVVDSFNAARSLLDLRDVPNAAPHDDKRPSTPLSTKALAPLGNELSAKAEHEIGMLSTVFDAPSYEVLQTRERTWHTLPWEITPWVRRYSLEEYLADCLAEPGNSGSDIGQCAGMLSWPLSRSVSSQLFGGFRTVLRAG